MAEDYAESQKERMFQLALLAVAAWSVIYARFALGPLQETMRIDLGFSDNQIAILNGPAVAIPTALAAFPAGFAVDRFKRTPIVIGLLATGFFALVFTAFSTSMILLLLGRILTGVVVGAAVVAVFSIMADLCKPSHRGRGSMIIILAEAAGGPAAFFLGGTLLAAGGSTGILYLDGWRAALLWMCLPLLLCFVLALLMREPTRKGVRLANPSFRQIWPELWKFRAIIGVLIVGRAMAWIGDGAAQIWGAPTFERIFGLAPQEASSIMATAMLISGIAGPLLGGSLADYCYSRGGPRQTITILAFAMTISIPAACYGIMPNATIAAFSIIIFLLTGLTGVAAAMAIATTVIPNEIRGVYISISIAGAAVVSYGLAPVIVSGLSTFLGGPMMIGYAQAMVGGSTAVIGALIFYTGRVHFPGCPTPEAVHREGAAHG